MCLFKKEILLMCVFWADIETQDIFVCKKWEFLFFNCIFVYFVSAAVCGCKNSFCSPAGHNIMYVFVCSLVTRTLTCACGLLMFSTSSHLLVLPNFVHPHCTVFLFSRHRLSSIHLSPPHQQPPTPRCSVSTLNNSGLQS